MLVPGLPAHARQAAPPDVARSWRKELAALEKEGRNVFRRLTRVRESRS